MKWSEYNAIVKGKVVSRWHLTHPYMLCAMCCVATVLQSIGGDTVYFLFDRQEGLRRETMQKLRDIVFDFVGIDSRVKGLDFIKRQDTVCLDPADYLAFVVRERDIDSTSAKATLGASIIGTKGGYGGRVEAEQLEWMVKRWNDPNDIQNIVADLVKNPFFRGPK